MGLQIFPESFYTKLLCNGERIRVTPDNTFEILSPESFCSRLKRFLTFRQDPNIDKVHNLFKTLLEQVERKEGEYFLTLEREIHDHGQFKYRYLESNLIYLRKKLDSIGHPNSFSEMILKIDNTVLNFFGATPIQLRSYENSFYFHWTSGNYTNPLEREGLKLTPHDEATCHFSADHPVAKIAIQKLEKGIKDYYSVRQSHRNYNYPGMGTESILANLEVAFDQERQQFYAAVHNPHARHIYSPFNDLNGNERIGPERVSPLLFKCLNELPEDEKTFRYFVKAISPEGRAVQHELAWILGPQQQDSLQLNTGSEALFLQVGTQYEFYDENHRLITSFKITLNQ